MQIARSLVASLLLLSAIPAEAGRKPNGVSWAKAGVSFEEYQRDTLQCANRTYGLDVSMRPQTAVALAALNGAELAGFVTGLNLGLSNGGSDYRGGPIRYAAVMNVIEPGRVIFRNSRYTDTFRHAAYSDVVEQLQSVLDYCLRSRGYHRFALNADQRRQLRRYAQGTEERARYLHSLASANSS